MINRRTSVYTMNVHCPTIRDAVFTASAMATYVPENLVGVGTDLRRAYVRFRVADDAAALALAQRVATAATERPFVLQTGVGIHRRDVAQ